MTLAERARAIEEVKRPFLRPGFEHVRGFGVMAAPFTSGHVLVLRAFPENDFAPYRSVWHRTPEGDWSIYVDGPRLETGCPRYFGAAAQHSQRAKIELTWTGPSDLLVRMDTPALEWTVSMKETLFLKIVNGIHPRLPEASWRPAFLVRARELMARQILDMGDIRLRDTTPSGHQAQLMPERMYLVAYSTALLDGVNLGRAIRSAENPVIGASKLSARPVFAIGRAYFKIADVDEYRRTLEEIDDAAS